MKRPFLLALLIAVTQTAWAQSFHYLDLTQAANRGVTQSLDEAAGVQDIQEKSGFKNIPSGIQTFRGIPFQVLDPKQNKGLSFVTLKGHRLKDLPEAVSILVGGLKAAELFFLHTCRWGGTASDIKVAEYDIVYDDGKVVVVPLHVGAELSNFWYADDTSVSYLAWWNKYKNAEMGVNLFPWKNPRPDVSIRSILFKSLGKMPVPILFAVTASDKEVAITAPSPKPERTVQNDTSQWVPLPAVPSFQGTALDMTAFLDAPAGKHGLLKADYDKLVFADGKPARFWGTVLTGDWAASTPEQMSAMAEKLASTGCNVVGFDLSKFSVAPESLRGWIEALKLRGIYTCPLNAEKTALPETFAPEPALIPAGLLTFSEAKWGDLKGDAMVLHPEESLPAQLTLARPLGIPDGVRWSDHRPNEYLAETPMLLAAYGIFQNWDASLGMEMSVHEGGDGMGADLSGLPLVLAQWPAASLAYLRGDLKEGRLHVLKADPATLETAAKLKALAHRSGSNPGKYRLNSDPTGDLTAKVKVPERTLLADSKQLQWQGNVGVVQVDSPRFQALIGFLGHRKFNNYTWAVETPNLFASVSAISLVSLPISVSPHILITAATRAESEGTVYNQARTKLLEKGKGPLLMEPFSARVALHRLKKDPKLKVRALDAQGQVLAEKVPYKWVKNDLVTGWIPSALHLEIYK